MEVSQWILCRPLKPAWISRHRISQTAASTTNATVKLKSETSSTLLFFLLHFLFLIYISLEQHQLWCTMVSILIHRFTWHEIWSERSRTMGRVLRLSWFEAHNTFHGLETNTAYIFLFSSLAYPLVFVENRRYIKPTFVEHRQIESEQTITKTNKTKKTNM